MWEPELWTGGWVRFGEEEERYFRQDKRCMQRLGVRGSKQGTRVATGGDSC